jgi:hypothetical protein
MQKIVIEKNNIYKRRYNHLVAGLCRAGYVLVLKNISYLFCIYGSSKDPATKYIS